MVKRKGVILILGISYLLIPMNKNEVEHTHFLHDHMVKKENAYKYEENVQTFVGPEGKNHKIYWAYGIEAPLMSYNEADYGKPGYFDKEIEVNNAVTYVAEMQPNKGYYDLNKNLSRMGDKTQIGDESPHCYLNSSSNLILWWLEQNKDLVTDYVTKLLTSDVYGQVDGLINVFPGQKETWEKIYKEPGVALIKDYYRQESGLTSLVTDILSPYYRRYFDGFAYDKVWDFFFNGYQSDADYSGNDLLDENKEEDFKKDPLGGYFFNIFENHRLTKRYQEQKYKKFEWYEDNLKNFFLDGKALNLGYLFAGGSQAHAITVWGAEYGPNDELIRLFVTDSDDYESSANDKGTYLRGLHSMNAKRNSAGNMIIGNNPGENNGTSIQSIGTLSLGRDIFEARLKDISAPETPNITNTSKDRVYGQNGNYTIQVDATVEDTGTLTYQWYESDSLDKPGKLIANEKKNTLKIDTKNIGVKYYYCEVINQKNGKTTSLNSRYIKADVQDIPLVHAATPKVRFNYNVAKIEQYSKPPRLEVFASSPDHGELTYQWYIAYDNSARNGTLIKGATKSYFYPPTTESARFYYYCVVTNTKISDEITGNYQTSRATDYSKRIEISPTELVDAKGPLIIDLSTDKTYEIGEKIEPLFVDAKAYDKGTLSYQWNQIDSEGNSKIIEGANSQSYLPILNKSGIYKYSCTITNNNEFASNNKINKYTTDIVTLTINDSSKLSDDYKLVSLNISNAVISPSFNKDINYYTANVGHNITKLNVDATSDPKSTISITNPDLSYENVNEVLIEVTSESGIKNVYKIQVTRDSIHEFGEWEIVNDSTCTENGIKRRTCKYCDHYEEEIIAKKEHTFTEWKVIKEASETEEGLMQRECKVCGQIETKSIPKLNHEHKFGEWTLTKPATCTEDGIETRTCSCGLTETRVIKATGHDWGEWTIVEEPTYEKAGLEERVCKICGETETRIIDKLEKPVEPENPEIPNPDVPDLPDPNPEIPDTQEPEIPNTKPDIENPTEPEVKPDPETPTEPETNPDQEIPDTQEPETPEKPDLPGDDEKGDNNVGIIIAAVAIPSSILLIAGIILFILKYKH